MDAAVGVGSMKTFVPNPESKAVQKLLTALGTDTQPISLRVVVTSHGAKEGYCYQNVSEKVRRVGGRAQLGWAIWEHDSDKGGLFIEAEPHAVYDPENGQPWIDPTPNFFADGSRCEEILFIPNETTRDPKSAVVEDNIRVPLVDDPQLVEALKLASELIALRNRARSEGESDAMKLEYVQLGGRYSSALSAAEQRAGRAPTIPIDMEFVLAADDGDIEAMKRTNAFRQMLAATPPEKHGALDALLVQMVREKKGKMTAGMRAVIKKAIRA